jgi:glycogen(starch) synthase
MSRQLRILYAVGPENVMEAYQYWKINQAPPSQVSLPYSTQLYQVCKDLDAKAYVLAQALKKEFLQEEEFIVELRPVLLANAGGLLYHLSQVLSGIVLLLTAIRFRANVIVADSGTTHWFVLSAFDWMGINVIPSLHCVLWRKYAPLRQSEKLTLKLSRNVFSVQSKAILAASQDAAKQVSELTGGKHPPIFEFFPTYPRSYFANIAAPNTQKPYIFRVLFAGRVEKDKGVFDLLEIAKRFLSMGIQDIIFDLCGDGTALKSLRDAVTEAGVESSFICHGYCQKPKMQEMYTQAHVVIVPTRTEFIEGFNRVVAESILCGRPVVTSSVCPALSYVHDAVIEVPPNDITAYGDALLELYKNPQLYEQKRLACLSVQEQFYDMTRSWGAALKHILIGLKQHL